MYLHIHELKGKRSKNIPIDTLEKLEICIRVKEEIQDNERVCKIKEGSINAEVKRILVKNKISRYKKAKTCVHAIRKAYAKKEYLKTLEETNDEKKSWDKTAQKLGYGEGRIILKKYI